VFSSINSKFKLPATEYNSVLSVCEGFKQECNGWHKPQDYHYTCLYIGKEHTKVKSPIYQGFSQGANIQIEIVGVVVVSNQIIIGICFPKSPSENACPHVTLMLNQFKPADSNEVLVRTCLDDGPFAVEYNIMKYDGKIRRGNEVKHG
jgi:hypothetical protein